MEAVTSAAGTKIAYERSGSGPALVIVHGSINDKEAWGLVRPALEGRYTVYALNRRGRAGSADAGPHRIEDEGQDVAAVVNAIGEPVHLLGHSFGALCAMEATLLTDNVKSLILYEPPPPGAGSSAGWREELRAQVDAGRPDDAIATFLANGPEVPRAQIEALRASEGWPRMVTQAQSLVEEIDAMARYRFEPSRFAHVTVPVLLLFGDQSPAKLRTVNEALEGALPNAQIRLLAGQGHAAHMAAPDLLASEVLRLLDSVEER